MSQELTITNQDTIELKRAAIEANIQHAEKVVERGKALERLMNNDDFKNVILDGYIGDLAESLFLELTKPLQSNSIPYESCKEGLEAIRHIQSYIGSRDGSIPGDIYYNKIKATELIEDELDRLKELG